MRLGYASVPVMNTTVEFCSELAQALAALGYPFAAVFWHTSAGVTYSLRSQPAVYGEDGEVHEHAGSNVALVAEGYGGGGHAHAAGFRVAAPLPMEHGVFLS